MPPKIRQLKSDLRKAGFVLSLNRGKESHTVWVHPCTGTSVTVSGGDGDDAKRYQESDVRNAIVHAVESLRAKDVNA